MLRGSSAPPRVEIPGGFQTVTDLSPPNPHPPARPVEPSRPAVLWGGAALIVALALAAYANSFSGVFVYDDIPAIVDNPTIRTLRASLAPPADSGLPVSGRPLVNLSLALNYRFGGLHPWGYHAFNLGVHLAASLVLFGLIRRALLSPPLRAHWSPLATSFAGVASAIWAVHPVHTESVTYVVQRAEAMVGLFYLLTLYCVARATEEKASPLWPAAAAASCALGMATKEVMVSAPLLALLYDRAFGAGTIREALRRRWRLYAALGATWGILVWLVAQSASRGGTAGFGTGVPWWSYLLTQSGAILLYLRLAFWPAPLVFDYGTDVATTFWAVAGSFALVATLAAISLVAAVRRPAIGFVALAFFAFLAPSSSIVPVASEVMAEHRLYLPLACVVVATLCLFQRWGIRAHAALFLAVIPLAFATAHRNRDYHSDLALWRDTVQKVPSNPRALFNLGEIHDREGRRPEAIDCYRRAIRLRINLPSAHTNLSRAFLEEGQVEAATAHALEALRFNPQLAEAHGNLANARAAAGDVRGALGPAEEAVRLKPESVDLRNNLGAVLSRLSRLAEAETQYRASLRLEPTRAQTHFYLGNTLARSQRWEEAARAYEEALKLKPDFQPARDNLARVKAAALR